jgi:hypothetical protein
MSNVSLTHPFMSLSVLLRQPNFVNGILIMGGSGEGEGGGTGNDVAS